MSRVEISNNQGPNVFHTFDDTCGGTCISKPTLVEHYTLHSYQFIHESGGSTVTIEIEGSNYEEDGVAPTNNKYWSTIYSDSLAGGSDLAYYNFWNFKYARVKITGTTSANITIAEKHNP